MEHQKLWIIWKRITPSSHYINPLPPHGGELDTGGLRELLGRALLSSPSCVTPLPLSLSCGSPKGCVGARVTPSLHDEVLWEFWIGSKPIYFHNLGWIQIRKESS
jgi:hypothetical protein